MHRSDFSEYWKPAREIFAEINESEHDTLDNNYNYRRSKALADLLGIDYPESGYYRELELTAAQKHTCKLLSGSGGWIVRKILEARKK